MARRPPPLAPPLWQIKATKEICAIPVIALTAHAMIEDRDHSLQAGCDDHETKPVDFARLLRKIQTLLHGAAV